MERHALLCESAIALRQIRQTYFITTMKIETITYKRVKNLGDYQSETFEATATVEEGDDPQVVGEGLKAFVYGQLYRAVVKDDEDEGF